MRIVPLVIAVVLALVAGFVALKMFGKEEEQLAAQPVVTQAAPQQTETSNVYIAAQYIPIGSVLGQEQVSTQPWPSNLVGETFITDAQPPETVIGKIARASFQAGEPISLTKLAGPGEGSFLAGSLPKGMRAVTINTDETMGVAGFIFPGDRVDVLVTHQFTLPTPPEGQQQSMDRESITETLLSNVVVLAVDQIANAQEIAANSQEQQGEGQPQSTIHVSRTVTLMVNPVDGEKLRLGEKVGQLSMALRSIEDHETVDMASLLRYQNITQYPIGSSGAAGGSDAGIRVIRGVEATNVTPVVEPAPVVPMISNPLTPTDTTATTATTPAASSTASDAPPPVVTSPAATPAPAASVTPAPAATPAPVAAAPSVVKVPAEDVLPQVTPPALLPPPAASTAPASGGV